MDIDNGVKWDFRFLKIAQEVATWSKDPSTKVGAVITDSKHRIMGLGYNGFPREVSDDESDYNDRELKYMKVVHAEVNAILNANGSVEGATLYSTHFPCCHCASIIIQSGIKYVVSYASDKDFCDRFSESINIASKMFDDAGVYVWIYDKGFENV